ncbi:MAG: ATP-dependent DNA helicase [Candidimonas sp.]|nr:MAG: ATP-dependent DNA helicase [Candidimonas sp.]
MLLRELTDIFAADGPIAAAVPNYHARQTQLEMAQAVDEAIRDRGTLVAEAGTGTGKTWAYLVPAFLSGARVLVSTGTRPLQDQLFRRDVPRLREALALPVRAALLKGRSNYVCHYHLDRLSRDDRALTSRAEVTQLRRIQEFARQTRSGDKAELSTVPEDADIWNRVTSTRENCLGQDCPFVRECFVLKARREAQNADLVVVNHALFMADLALREEGVTDLLPEVDAVVFDEAHQLPDIATQFLGTHVSSHQLLDLVRIVQAAGLAHAREAANWGEVGRGLEQAAGDLRLAAAPIATLPGRHATFQALPDAPRFDDAMARLLERLDDVAARLGPIALAHPDLDAALKTCLNLRRELFRWTQPDRAGHDAFTAADTADAGYATGPAVRWVEAGPHAVRLHSVPLSVSSVFSSFRRDHQAWIFTSATLSLQGRFNYFVDRLGLKDAVTRRWESPFDYAVQGILFVPRGLPPPGTLPFEERFVEMLVPIVRACPGGALVLCTTLRAVGHITELLRAAFAPEDGERFVLRQGEGSRRSLLERFRAGGRMVLVGSASFWEGVDVPGEALTLVAIDKLPFAPPDDPVLEARLASCRARGGNPFVEFQLPEAALSLKQGAGRLIRSETDWGVLVVGDGRLVDKPYGKLLWRGLPPFARTRDAARVLAFLTQRGAASGGSVAALAGDDRGAEVGCSD